MYILNYLKKFFFKKQKQITENESSLFPKISVIEGKNLSQEQAMLNNKLSNGICVTKVSIPDSYCGNKKQFNS